ncbi:MAG: S1/P1 nuclease [Pseudomonadota bacterium]
MKKLVLTVALSGAFISFNAQAWGNDGHRAVGAIADQLIQGSNAEQRVKALLLPGESLEKVAIWADCVKGTYCGPQNDEMLAYVAANPRHAEYHYTDVPFQNQHYHDHDAGTADIDIVQTLKQCIATLQGKGDKISNPHGFTQRQALLILTHLAGDVVQPLHVGAAFVDRNGAFVVPQTQAQVDAVNMFDARGGNDLLLDDVKLSAISARLIPAAPAAPPSAPQTTRPFHSYWDTTVVSYVFRRVGARSPQEFAQLAIAGKPAVISYDGDPIAWPYAWADQSLAVSKLAHKGVSAGAVGQQTGKNGEVFNVWALTVPDDYPVPSSAAARTQLIQGGYNLAAVLKSIWP